MVAAYLDKHTKPTNILRAQTEQYLKATADITCPYVPVTTEN
jgi:hypothetical protein